MIYCNEPDFTTIIKSCPVCEGDVHLHFGDKDENGFWLLYHCHICGEETPFINFLISARSLPVCGLCGSR